ncbi:Ferritin-like domain protein [Planctomycetes bacterium Pan216]|uniref:Ferritin-like domain protein n=1 Tax=Kolteria novifilia TaxID=2527975 RepID=A0A518B3S9_9BACT|nr:Ferritin-like domain protein [Planctomycetes bacterium Pan216]
MASQELIGGLNDQLNREVTTFLRYMLQVASIKGAQWHSVRDMYQSEVTDEVEHAQYLADQIVMLGGKPDLHPDLTPPPSDVREMLQRDSEEERIDVRNYIELASLAEKEGLVALKMQMEDQAADEDAHGQEMQRLLG